MSYDCHKCDHYYVTWDKNFPHGCKAMGFKGRQLPIFAVRKTTPDMECLSFEEKKHKPLKKETDH